MIKMYGDIKNLNETLIEAARYKLVTFKEFKKLHKHDKKGGINWAVAHVDHVEQLENGFKFVFDNKKRSWTIFYDGRLQKGKQKPEMSFDDERIRYNNFCGINSSMYPERLIGIAILILNDQLPSTFKGLAANLMDGSGNFKTAEKLGISLNLDPMNIEWTTEDLNRNVHGKAIIKMYEATGHVYSFSANDKAIYDCLGTHHHKWLRHYMMMNYKRIK